MKFIKTTIIGGVIFLIPVVVVVVVLGKAFGLIRGLAKVIEPRIPGVSIGSIAPVNILPETLRNIR